MVVGQPTGVHQHPAFLGILDGAVVANEPASAALVIDAGAVERDVDGVGRRVVVGSEEGLFVWSVSHHEVHDGAGRLKMVGRKSLFQLKIHCMYKSDRSSFRVQIIEV